MWNGWIAAGGAAFALAEGATRAADRCVELTRRRPKLKHAGEAVEGKVRELAELAHGGALLLVAKGAIETGQPLLFWAAFERAVLFRGEMPGGCAAMSPTRCGCLLMAGHERRGYDVHVDRHGRAWVDA